MTEMATLTYKGQTYQLPVVEGTEGEKGIDISKLRQKSGLITLDSGYANTGSCTSAITFMDGEKGILRYRGIPVEQLAKYSTFRETAFLLVRGYLPTQRELNRFSVLLNDASLVHEDMKVFYQNFPKGSHPMGILSSMVNALRSFYPELQTQTVEEEIDVTVTRLLSKVRTLAAMSYKMSRGHTVVYPRPDLSYCANFLNMMFDSPVKPYEIDDDLVEALNVFWILHADHEQNCSTSAVRMVGSGRVNLYAAISAGIAALWGPLHGGANQAVIEMLEDIATSGAGMQHYVDRAKDRQDPFRLMGFGHRVYKTYDPRAKIIKAMCDRVLTNSRSATPCWTWPRNWKKSPSKTTILSNTISTRTWISTAASSCGPSASPPTCLPSCLPSAGCRDGSPSGRKAWTTPTGSCAARDRSMSVRPSGITFPSSNAGSRHKKSR
jgi:citrate synthase